MVEQAAEYLGIAMQTVYQWCSEKTIPYYKMGSYDFFDADELDAYRAKGKVIPISEVVKQRQAKTSSKKPGEGEKPSKFSRLRVGALKKPAKRIKLEPPDRAEAEPLEVWTSFCQSLAAR